MSQSGWPSSKQWNWLLFIKETEMFTSVVARVMWVLLFESKASWSGPGAMLVPLVPHCTVPGCVVSESGSWTTVRHHSFHGAVQTASCVIYAPLSITSENSIYSCIFCSFSGHAVFFLTSAGQFFVSLKWRPFMVQFMYLLKQWNSAIPFFITNIVSVS